MLTRGDDVCIIKKLSENGAPKRARRRSKKLQKTLKKVLKSGWQRKGIMLKYNSCDESAQHKDLENWTISKVCLKDPLSSHEKWHNKSNLRMNKSKSLCSPEQEFKLRVWSWLRTNAGGAPNTCKSNGVYYLEPFGVTNFKLSGGRVSNTWVICLCEGDNIWKRMLIPHNVFFPHERNTKDLSHKDELAAD